MRTEGILAERVRSSRHDSFSMVTSSSQPAVPFSWPRKRLATTSRLSHRARSWNTVEMPSACASLGPPTCTTRPANVIVPVGLVDPEMILISVDLPAPLSPTSATTSPGATSRLTSVSACTAPNLLLMPSRERTAVPAGAGRSVVVAVMAASCCRLVRS